MVTHRSRSVALAAAVVAAILLLASCGGGGGKTVASGEGDGPPAFDAATLAGAKLDSKSLAGKPTVLWFWAPWCTICRGEAPDIAKASQALKGKVDIIGVAGRGEVPAMQEFVDQTGLKDLTHIVDKDGSIWSSYGVAAQPAFAFIDAKGTVTVVSGRLGYDDLNQRMKALASA